MIRQEMQAIGDSIRQCDKINDMVSEMDAARTESKELTALLGKSPTAGFTSAQAQRAATAGLDTAKYSEFQTSFQAYTGQYVGAEEASPEELEKNHQKLSGERARRLQSKVASYAIDARGLSADDSACLLDTIVAKSAPGSSDDEIAAQYVKLMKVMELAPGRTSPMISQLAELGMEMQAKGAASRI